MKPPKFLNEHRLNKEDVAFFHDTMSNPNKARVWIAETRAIEDAEDRFSQLGKAMVYELTMRVPRVSVLEQLRGAYNRARGHVDGLYLDEWLEDAS